jgi:nitrogen regulatory protein PII-like uncharacterized protein
VPVWLTSGLPGAGVPSACAGNRGGSRAAWGERPCREVEVDDRYTALRYSRDTENRERLMGVVSKEEIAHKIDKHLNSALNEEGERYGVGKRPV